MDADSLALARALFAELSAAWREAIDADAAAEPAGSDAVTGAGNAIEAVIVPPFDIVVTEIVVSREFGGGTMPIAPGEGRGDGPAIWPLSEDIGVELA